MIVDQRGGAGKQRARGREVDDVLRRLHPRPCVRLRARLREPLHDVGIRALRDAERDRCVEESGVDVPLDVRRRVTDRKATAERRRREPHVLERHRVTARSAHAERVPIVVDGHSRCVARDHRVAVALMSVLIGEGDRRVEDVRRRRPVLKTLRPDTTQPSSDRVAVVAGRVRSCRASLTADANTTPSAAICRSDSARASSPLVPRGDGGVPTAYDVLQVCEVHVHAEGQRRVAAGESGRSDEYVVRRGDSEAAELAGDRGREVAASLECAKPSNGKLRIAIVLGCVGPISTASSSASATSRAPGAVLGVSSKGTASSARSMGGWKVRASGRRDGSR